MAEILDYFDNINIDVAKRKYYNINKVNAVLEELRDMAVKLVDENEKQRQELESLRAELAQKSADSCQMQQLLTEMQELYRDTLDQAHQRADGIVQNAEAQSEKLKQEASEKTGLITEQINDCFEALQKREEENANLLKSRLQQILSVLNGKKEETSPDEQDSDRAGTDSDTGEQNTPTDVTLQVNAEKEDEEDSYKDDQMKALELQIQKLAEEISALESGL